ncbi:hypothetical protein [Antrihabitans sp. YC2-6]|uniref:hypothetical protein n=1 Tax=Antrihabitans sp. YC2-6 TaxID=2799498 RepID=UPI0018F7B2E0|nr:hypothetical protein [Antrihabitans sp. YC2-6]MBJ8347097.1 hypothetical protein [Antrihabitans sp. YC2-6]
MAIVRTADPEMIIDPSGRSATVWTLQVAHRTLRRFEIFGFEAAEAIACVLDVQGLHHRVDDAAE